MKAPLTRLAVIAFSLALVGSMALTTHATGTTGNNSSSNNQTNNTNSNSSQPAASPMGGCCGPSQPQGQ